MNTIRHIHAKTTDGKALQFFHAAFACTMAALFLSHFEGPIHPRYISACLGDYAFCGIRCIWRGRKKFWLLLLVSRLKSQQFLSVASSPFTTPPKVIQDKGMVKIKRSDVYTLTKPAALARWVRRCTSGAKDSGLISLAAIVFLIKAENENARESSFRLRVSPPDYRN